MDGDSNEQTDPKLPSLSEAFTQSAASNSQEDKGDKQDSGGSGETSQDPTSRSDPGTDPSRQIDDTTREAILASLTPDEIKSHPTLKSAWQSAVDSGVAASMRGKTVEIEERLRKELTLEKAKEHFDSLSEEELGSELAKDPNARQLYAAVQNRPAPTPPDPEKAAAITAISRTIEFYDKKLQGAGLPKETLDKLTPGNWLPNNQQGTADEILERWTSEVDKAIIDFAVTKELAKSGKSQQKSEEVNQQAQRDSQRRGAVMENGVNKPPPLDLTQAKGSQNLYEAFSRQGSRS